MRPTLAAEELKRNLTQFLSTTFALADQPVRDGLEKFLNDPGRGIFRGPYLRIRTPFQPAGPGWRDILDWAPREPAPYLHQAQAWARLTTRDGHEPQPTLITTGTGSGKTEAFLVPVLDHCRRERFAGNSNSADNSNRVKATRNGMTWTVARTLWLGTVQFCAALARRSPATRPGRRNWTASSVRSRNGSHRRAHRSRSPSRSPNVAWS
ncbi:MAG TPA: hypothetical protein VG104_03260, partial [Candidatus Dormibacteraeota bacterium]|nr:hypothetical protein [Candidatus Dormibacteraeota bacterium]